MAQGGVDEALFLAVLPLLLRNAGAVRALGAEPAWAPSFTSDDVTPQKYAVLSTLLRESRDAATAARACARVARVCVGACTAAAAAAPHLGPNRTAQLAARARAARRIEAALVQLQMLPRPASELAAMLRSEQEQEGDFVCNS